MPPCAHRTDSDLWPQDAASVVPRLLTPSGPHHGGFPHYRAGDARILSGEKVVEGTLPDSWPTVKTVTDTRLTGGETIGSLEVVPTPGHSPAFPRHPRRHVIAGDVFTSFRGVAVSNHFTFPFPFAAMATWDQASDLESARAIRALNPSLLVVGHGPATSLPAAAIDTAITQAQR